MDDLTRYPNPWASPHAIVADLPGDFGEITAAELKDGMLIVATSSGKQVVVQFRRGRS